MANTTGYSLAGYGDMISGRPRMEPYVQALRQAIRPGCVVLDIGAGTGIFSLLACQLGAGHVHAVEPDNAIQVARDMAAANGYAERITFHQALSTAVTLPAPADVIISDLRGVLPLLQGHIPAIADARHRLLAPGGVLIPRRDTLWAALVEGAELYRRYAEPWLANDYGLDLSAGQPLVVNSWRKVNAKPEQLLVPPRCWAALDYGAIEEPDVSGELGWTAERAGTAHGLLVWFDAELADGIGFSNAPGQPELIYGQAFFPLQKPIELASGVRVVVRLAADLTGDDYIWRWATAVFSSVDPLQPRLRFEQSTFFGTPLALARLRRHAAGYVPRLEDGAEIDRFILAQIDGQTALGAIANRVLAHFPAQFPRWENALTRAGELAERYWR